MQFNGKKFDLLGLLMKFIFQIRHFCFICFLLLNLTPMTYAQFGENIELVNHAIVSGQMYAGASGEGNLFFCATGFGIKAISLEDVDNPVEISHCPTPGEALDLLIFRNYAYVADGTAGLTIVDISDPQNMEFLISIPPIARNKCVHIQRELDRLYVEIVPIRSRDCIWGTYVLIFDLADPDNPRLLNNGLTLWGTRFIVEDDILFSISHSGITVFDVSDPNNINRISSFYTGRPAYDQERFMQIKPCYQDHKLLIAWGNHRDNNGSYFSIIDVEDLQRPRVVNHFYEESHFGIIPDLAVHENHAYISHANKIINLNAFDEEHGVIDHDFDGQRLYLKGDDLIELSGSDSDEDETPFFNTYNFDRQNLPQRAGELTISNAGKFCFSHRINKDLVYARINNNLYSFPIDNSNQLLNFHRRGSIFDFNNRFMIITYRDIFLFSMNDPVRPVFIEELDVSLEGSFGKGNTYNSLRCSADWAGILWLWDFSDFRDINLLSRIDQNDFFHRTEFGNCQIIGDNLYSICEYRNPERISETHLVIYSIENPEEPVLVSAPLICRGSNRLKMQISDNLIFIPSTVYHNEAPWGRVAGYGLEVYELIDNNNVNYISSLFVSSFY